MIDTRRPPLRPGEHHIRRKEKRVLAFLQEVAPMYRNRIGWLWEEMVVLHEDGCCAGFNLPLYPSETKVLLTDLEENLTLMALLVKHGMEMRIEPLDLGTSRAFRTSGYGDFTNWLIARFDDPEPARMSEADDS